MNIKNLFGYTRWIYEVCQHPDHRALKARNDSRLAALKATNSLIENERTRARTHWLSPGSIAGIEYYCIGSGGGSDGMVNGGGRGNEQWGQNADLRASGGGQDGVVRNVAPADRFYQQ